MTRQGRLGMNGPEVIEQEAGIEELDASDRRRIWQLIGGEQRVMTGLADHLAGDDIDEIGAAVRAAFAAGVPAVHRSEAVDDYLSLLARVDPRTISPDEMRALSGHLPTAERQARNDR
jgi:malonate decarboxylase beta subunit